MTNGQRVLIRMDLEGDLAQKFLAIKRHRSIRSNTEVVRFLISEYYDERLREVP